MHKPDAEASQHFFATVQNKMHWAAHGHTAAEICNEPTSAGRLTASRSATSPVSGRATQQH